MRISSNPAKLHIRLDSYGSHRVVIPVYIPHQTEYFTQSLAIFNLCLESLQQTASGMVSITVVANGCVAEVLEKLHAHFDSGRIHQLVINDKNRGKVDAVLGVARGSFEPLITIADSDVLFRPGWVQAVEGLFHVFPECGFVSPSPSPNLAWYQTSATVLGALQKREVQFEKVVSDIDLDRFEVSVGSPDLFTKHRRIQAVVRRHGGTACIGAGHFAFTIRREALLSIPTESAADTNLTDADRRWLDVPPDQAGFWRLSTTRSFAYHMGNVPEQWMYDELKRSSTIPSIAGIDRSLPPIKRPLGSRLPWRVRRVLMSVYQHWAAPRFDKATHQ